MRYLCFGRPESKRSSRVKVGRGIPFPRPPFALMAGNQRPSKRCMWPCPTDLKSTICGGCGVLRTENPSGRGGKSRCSRNRDLLFLRVKTGAVFALSATASAGNPIVRFDVVSLGALVVVVVDHFAGPLGMPRRFLHNAFPPDRF